jgi:hypothetical protein
MFMAEKGITLPSVEINLMAAEIVNRLTLMGCAACRRKRLQATGLRLKGCSLYSLDPLRETSLLTVEG